MAKEPAVPKPNPDLTGDWTDRVALSEEGGGFAYRPRQVVTTGGDAALEVARRTDRRVRRDDNQIGPFTRLLEVGDPIRLVHELRLHGFVAQPNHVFFADCRPCCPPHPAVACSGAAHGDPVYASPVYASPVYASPVYASPVYASPVYASPVYASPATEYRNTGRRRSAARPGPAPRKGMASAAVPGAPNVVILDTGLGADAFRPDSLRTPAGDQRIVAATAVDVDEPDESGDRLLDPAAGHGSFIAGLIEQVAPGCTILLGRVLSTFGDGDEWRIGAAISAVADGQPELTLLNLSFSGYAFEQAYLLAWAVRRSQDAGQVVVASAGNDATCRPTLPASLPNVVSVGAVGPTGPAPFTNYGPWVRACAPGVDLVSSFFRDFDGDEPPLPDGTNPDLFDGTAVWSGTSFAAPVVVGALAREMTLGGTGADAVARVVDEPRLMRIPNLGTVVNVL